MTSVYPTASGIDPSIFDPAVHPGDDLFRHVNGMWLNSYTIPADRSMDGAFRALHDAAEIHVRDIIHDAAAATTRGNATANQQKIGALFADFMDSDAIESAGISPIADEIADIMSASNSDELAAVLGRLQRHGGGGIVGMYVDNDAKNPDRYLVHLYQSGLGLPDEAYYREDAYAPIRAEYRTHLARMLNLSGRFDAEAASTAADDILILESHIASHHWDVVKDRDADLTYNLMTLEQLDQAAPHFPWGVWAAALGAPDGSLSEIIVREPDFVTGFATLWHRESLATWQAWAIYHLISARAPYLPEQLVQANFDFYGKVLSGTEKIRDRWKRGVSLVEGVLGEAVGQEYVSRHFPPSHKAKMDELVGHLIEAYRESISELAWMSDATKTRALEKLDTFTPKIGYPTRWRDYSTLDIATGDLHGNIRRAHAFGLDVELAKIGKPIDRDEWFMTPQTVNAYYNPGMNEIVFPAAILQPPFFDPDAEDAVNFGGIGAVIGHEIGHGFDDQGSKYDGDGRLNDWWTSDDRAEFDQRAAALIAQYNRYRPEQLGDDGPSVNGALTVGENIGDLGGLAIAIKAYQRALGASLENAPVLDGYTGLQRIFLSWALVWQAKGRDEEVARRIATDPHSPNEFRCNGVVRNLPEFYEAFAITPDHALYLAPADRVHIW